MCLPHDTLTYFLANIFITVFPFNLIQTEKQTKTMVPGGMHGLSSLQQILLFVGLCSWFQQ